MTDIPNPIRQIVARFGGPTKLALLIGRRQSTVWDWVNKGEVPFGKVSELILLGRQQKPPIIIKTDDFFSIPSG